MYTRLTADAEATGKNSAFDEEKISALRKRAERMEDSVKAEEATLKEEIKTLNGKVRDDEDEMSKEEQTLGGMWRG